MPKKPTMRTRADAARRCRSLYRLIRATLGRALSDREIARRWGMEWKSFAALKHGRRQVPRIDELERLATVLALPAADVFAAASSEPPAAAPAPEAALRLSLERVPDALFTVDGDGRIHDCNGALSLLSGRSGAELAGCALDALVTAESAAAARACVATAARDGQASQADVAFAAGSAARAVTLRATPVRDAAGALVGAQLVAQERRAAPALVDRRVSLERRGSPRAASAFVVQYRYRRRLREARVENFGRGGLFIQTNERLTAGARLELEWRLPGDSARVRATAVVAWSRAASTEGPAGIGVRFVAVG